MAGRKKAESPGSRLRREVLERYELDAAEMVMLERAAELADVAARVDAAVASSPLTATGSMGQLVANPLLLQQRKHHERLQRELEGLRLPQKDEIMGAKSTSRAAQRAAQQRWRRQKAGGG
jgi:hypothetical protein